MPSAVAMSAVEPVMGSAAAAEAADAAEAARRAAIRRPPPVVREKPAPLADPSYGMMGPAYDGDMPEAAEMLIDEAQSLRELGEYDRALTTLEQATVVAPRDGRVHLMKALTRCKAISAELDNIRTLSDLPEWGDMALRSRRVEWDVDIDREIRAGEDKRKKTAKEKQPHFQKLLEHTHRIAHETKTDVERYNSEVDDVLAPFQVQSMEKLDALVQELRSNEPKVHASAVQQLTAMVLPNPRLSLEDAEAAKAKKISDCLKIARMDRGVGLHTMITTLNSAAEQDQWAASTVVCTALEYDHATHEAFVSLGGLQGLVSSLASVSDEVQALTLQSLQHIVNSRALGSEYGTVDGVEHVIRASALLPAVGLLESDFHEVSSAAAELIRLLVSRSEVSRDALYGAGAVDALAARLRLLLPHHGARPVPHGDLPTDWGTAPDKTVRNLLPGVAHQDVVDATRKRLTKIFTEHKPRKLADVDALLQEWCGVEDELLYLVEQKYDFPSTLKWAQAALVEAEKVHSLTKQRKEKKVALQAVERAWHALKDEVPDLQQAYAVVAAAEEDLALAQAQCGGRKEKNDARAALVRAKTELETEKMKARILDGLDENETYDVDTARIADRSDGMVAEKALESAARYKVLAEDPMHKRKEEEHQQHAVSQTPRELAKIDERTVANPDALAETALTIVAPEHMIGPVSCRAALVNSLRAFVSHRNDIATAAVKCPHGLCEALTDTLWSDAPRNHANTLRLLHALCVVDEIPPETPPDPKAPPPVNWREEAQKRTKDCGAVQLCTQILRADDLDAIAWAARMVQVLARGPDEQGCTETKHQFREAGVVEALVKVTRGHEDHFSDDQARKQAKIALDVLEVDGPAIEREKIRQELIESQSTLCETISNLKGGNTFRARIEAAAWIRSFVFSHGSKSQDTALAEGIVMLLVDCLREFGPGSGMSLVDTNEALDAFGSLLLIVLRPELPNDPSRYAFSQAERYFEDGEYFEASDSYTQAIHARYPNLRDCFLARSACYAAMNRTDDAAQDTATAAGEWLNHCRRSEDAVRILLDLPDHEDPELEVYIATAISFVFRGLLEAPDELVIDAFQKIIDVADKACRERYSDIMIDVGPGAPIRWQRAAYEVVYSIARFEAVADKIVQVVSPRLEMKDRFTLYVCVVSFMRLKDELTNDIEAQDTAVATWAFRILGSGRPVFTANRNEPTDDNAAIEDRAKADARHRERKRRAHDKKQQRHLLNRQKDIIAVAKAQIQELSMADEIDVIAVRAENETIADASEKINVFEKQLEEMEAEDTLLEAEDAVAEVSITQPDISNKYLKVDGIQATAWLLQHPTCVDKGTKSEMVATLVQFVVWITMHSPHMQQVALADTVIFKSLFQSIAERPASFWGTSNELVDLLEDMTRSEVPMTHEYLMKAGILVGLEGCLGDPTLTERSVELMAEILFNMSKHAIALRIIVDTALDFPLQGILERVGKSLNIGTQMKCLQAMEALVRVDAGTSLGMVGQACENAAKSLVRSRTGVDPTGTRWDQTVLARANVLVNLISEYFEIAFRHLRETKENGDMETVFNYLILPGRKLRIAALQLLVADARAIEGPARALPAAREELVSWRLVIVGARDLPRADGPFAKSDPYVVVRWNDQLLGQTNVKIQTLNPIWEEDFFLMMPFGQDDGDLQLQVYDYDRVSDHDFMADLHLRVGDSEIPQRRCLRVRVIEARDLPKMDLLGKNDPYVTVIVDDGERKRTKTIDGGGAEPEWHEDLQWELMVAAPPAVKIMCYDEDVGSADDLIGSAMLNLHGKSATTMWEFDDWVSLESPGGTACGAVHVLVTWNPDPGNDICVGDATAAHNGVDAGEFKLSATVIECEKLPKSDTFGKNDVYVGLAAARQSRRTQTLNGAGANPIWCGGDGEKLYWNLAEAPPHLDVTVYDEDVGSADDLIGQCRIPLKQHLSNSAWVQEAWFQLEDIKERSAGRVKLRLEWSVVDVSKDASVVYTLNRELLNHKKQPAGKIKLRVEKLAQKVPEPLPVDVVAQAEHRKDVPNGNKVLDDDYIAAVDLVARLCWLNAMETQEKQELVLDLLEAVRMRCLTDHSSMPIARARLVDTVCNGAHQLIMIAVEPVKVKVFDRFWRDELHGYKWMIARATNPESARNCLVASAKYLAPDTSPVQLDSVAAWASKEHRAAASMEKEPDRCIFKILLYVAHIDRGRSALRKVVDLRLLLRLLQLVEDPDFQLDPDVKLDEVKVEAIRLWAVRGIPVMLDSKTEQEALVQYSGIDLLLPLINFKKKSCYDASRHVCEILWEIADILDTAQFDHIVFTMCTHEQCRDLLDKSEIRPFIRILGIDPSGVRDAAIAGWAVDWINTLLQRQGGAWPAHLATMGSEGYKVLRATAETAAEQIACTAVAALSSYIHQQREIDELSTLLWFVEATEIDHVHAVLPTLDATVVEMFARQMWEPHRVLDSDMSRHHLYIASCAISRYMCRPPAHPTRTQPTVAGRTGWGAKYGEKGISDWAESLPYFSPLLSFCFCASAIAPLAVTLPLPAIVAIGPKREEQVVLTILVSYLGLGILSLTTFVMWATRDRSFRAATQFPSPDWRSENFWGVGVTQVCAWFHRRWLDLKRSMAWCRHSCGCCAKKKAVGPSWGEALFNEGDVADRYRVDDADDVRTGRHGQQVGGTPSAESPDSHRSDEATATVNSKISKLMRGMRRTASQHLSREALESRASSVQMGFRRATQTADGSLKRCTKQLQTPRGKEAMYIAIDFTQFNGFCFLNHPCWRSSDVLGQMLSRCLALSHLQLSADLSASGSILAWTVAVLVVVLYVCGSKCLLITLGVKLQRLRHRFCAKVKIMPSLPPPTHAIDSDNVELIEFAKRAGLDLDPTPESYESDCRRIMRNGRALMLYLISNRFLLVFIGSAGFVPVTSHLMTAGACSYPVDYGRNYGPAKIARPQISRDLVCWDSTHRGLLWGSLSALGLFVPLVLLIEPMLQVAERGMAEVHVQQNQATVGLADTATTNRQQKQSQSAPLVVQWTPGYNACRAMGKLILVTVATWLPSEPVLLDICVLIVAGLLATACIVLSPCAVHGVLKLHVVVLASAMITAALSLYLRLNITGLPNANAVSAKLDPASELWVDGTMDQHCPTSEGFWLLMLAWSVLAGVTCMFRVWWGCLSWVWGRLMAIRAEEALNKKVMALAL